MEEKDEVMVLFQGDSITDFHRNRTDPCDLGGGYPAMVAGELGCKYPEENYFFCNKGVSGDRVVDLLARIKCDMINLKPAYMSILIGVNDVWHELDSKNGVSAEKFETVYNMILDEFIEACPDTKIMILEPFILNGGWTRDKGADSNRYITFRHEVELRAQAAKRVAEKHNLIFVPLQNVFDEAVKKARYSYWLNDGVHPTAMGHNLIKNEWVKAFEQIK